MGTHLPQRKRPVHVPPVERHNEPVILFVTIAIQPRRPALANAAFLKAFKEACNDADTWSVGDYLLMPDHIHLFASPAVYPPIGIKRWATYLKERLTKRLRTSFKEADALAWKWQSDCWDTQIRNQRHYGERWSYIRLNPVRQGLVDEPDDWPWQGTLNTLRW